MTIDCGPIEAPAAVQVPAKMLDELETVRFNVDAEAIFDQWQNRGIIVDERDRLLIWIAA